MLSAWIAVFDGRARLDRPGLVQYRTQTEYSTSHRPATRASRTKDAAAAPAPRPIRVLRRFVASDGRAPPNTWMNTSFITWKFEVTHSSQTECYARISREHNFASVCSPRRSATEWRAVRGATRAQLSRRLPPRARRTLRRPFIVLGSGSWTSRQCCQRENFTRRMGKMFLLILEIWKLWSLTRSALATCRRPQWRITKLFAWFDSKFMWSDCRLTVCLSQIVLYGEQKQ